MHYRKVSSPFAETVLADCITFVITPPLTQRIFDQTAAAMVKAARHFAR
jgi:hypothetical protein